MSDSEMMSRQALAQEAAVVSNQENRPLPEHLIVLPGGQWAVWKWIGLRGAGFSTRQILEIATPPCAEAADHLLHAEDNLAHGREAALAALYRVQDSVDADKRNLVKKVVRQVGKGSLVNVPEWPFAGKAEVESYCQSRAQVEAARANFVQAFAAAVDDIAEAIYQAASDNRFQEAVIWQNRHALTTAIQPLLHTSPGNALRHSHYRQHQELVANYLQRYCAKNDTIGFFGPVGWAKFVSNGPALVACPGPDLLACRNVYFEGWCIDGLAEVLSRNQAIRPWVAPRRIPSIYLEGTAVFLPLQKSFQLSTEQTAVLRACNGALTAQEIAQQLAQIPALGFKGDQDVFNILDGLSKLGLVIWTLDVPLGTYPERTLRQLLEQIQDERQRAVSLRTLGVFEKARAEVARAAGSAEKLNQALGSIENIFTRLTGISATRAHGKAYAARTLVYEDCRRDIEVKLGPKIVDALGPPLSLLLVSARWFTVQIAMAYRQTFKALYAGQARQIGSPVVPLINLWQQAQAILYNDHPPLAESLLPDFQERWSRILSLPLEQRQVNYTSAQLRKPVSEAFDVPYPGWKLARYHSPDVMIDAPSIEAICQDDYQLVLGELHLGNSTIRGSMFVEQHPSPEELLRAVELDLPEPRIVPILPKQWPELTARTRPVLVSPKDIQIVFSYDASTISGPHVRPISDFVVEECGGALMVRARDGQLAYEIIEFFAESVSGQSINCFKMLRPVHHTPRITIDRLVVSRETWRFAAQAVPFAYEKHEADRFVAARRWTQLHGIPRFVFVKTPTERKPFYVDFDSPLMVNILAKAVRRTPEDQLADEYIAVTEMLPNLQRAWLPDAVGQRYTSELRITAVDSAIQ